MIVDSHMHLGMSAVTPCVDPSIEAVLAQMDHLGIDVSISVGGSSQIFGRPEAGFETALEAYRLSGGRILSCAYFNPHYAEEDVERARRQLEHEAFVGIKIVGSLTECYADDERWHPAWRLASEWGVPLVVHSWWVSDYNPRQRYHTPDQFERYVRAYPEVNMILGHAGGRYEGHRAAAKLARSYPNVYMDLSGDSYSFGLVEWLVEQAGADRILFGSDLFMIDARTVMGRVLDADISLEAKRLILGENAVRLFRLM
ncbi:MAG: amidohydrolase family protein [Anaerolineae bacterium]|nr:amidohydrolase family protein [Anaerolineae bacterium]